MDIDRSKIDAFWSKVDIRSTDECWPWNGTTGNFGYGVFRINKEKPRNNCYAHRISWQLANGEIPKGNGYHGSCILHECDNPACVNPNHLRIGTVQDNVSDMVQKRRQAMGSEQWKAKLTESDVKEILRLLSLGKSQMEVARIFNINHVNISTIKLGKTWKHVSREIA